MSAYTTQHFTVPEAKAVITKAVWDKSLTDTQYEQILNIILEPGLFKAKIREGCDN